MRVGLLVLEVYLPGAVSLKDKRRVLRSIRDRVRHRFNVAVAETDHQDLLQRAELAFVSVADGEEPLRQLFDRIVEEAERIVPGGVAEVSRETIG